MGCSYIYYYYYFYDYDYGYYYYDYDYYYLQGYNYVGLDYLYFYVYGVLFVECVDELQVLFVSFIDGFWVVDDKISYLRIVGIFFYRLGVDGFIQYFVDVQIVFNWQIGMVLFVFVLRELVYLFFLGKMVNECEIMIFIYVFFIEWVDVDLLVVL